MTVSQSTPGSDPDKLETCGLGQALLWLAKRKPIVPEAAFYAISKASSLPRIKSLREYHRAWTGRAHLPHVHRGDTAR